MSKIRFANVIRWSARILGGLLFLMLVLFAIGEGLPNPMTQPTVVKIELFAMFAMSLGCLAGWKWEWFGGILVLGGYTCFCAEEWQTLNVQFPFGLVLFVGLLYLVSWWNTRRTEHRT